MLFNGKAIAMNNYRSDRKGRELFEGGEFFFNFEL